MIAKSSLCLCASLFASLFANEAESPPFGKPFDGLATRLVLGSDRYEEGEQFRANLDVTNVSKTPIKIAWSHEFWTRLRLTDAGGRVLKLAREPSSLDFRFESLKPGKQRAVLSFYLCGNQYSMYGYLKPGEYQLLWPDQGNETVEGARLPPAAEPVTFEVVSRKPSPRNRGMQELNADDISWGQEKGGLRARLRAGHDRFFVGAPVPITLELKNVSQETLICPDPRSRSKSAIKLDYVNCGPAPSLHGIGQPGNLEIAIKPGEIKVLDAVELSGLYFLMEPGTYSAVFSGAIPWVQGSTRPGERRSEKPRQETKPEVLSSNTFVFEVLPAKISNPFDKALKVLMNSRPDGWNLHTYRTRQDFGQPDPRMSRVHYRPYSFYYFRPRPILPAGSRHLGYSARAISFWIAREKAVEEPWQVYTLDMDIRPGMGLTAEAGQDTKPSKPESEYLGKSPYGYVFLKRPHGALLKLWPTARADIKRWLQAK